MVSSKLDNTDVLTWFELIKMTFSLILFDLVLGETRFSHSHPHHELVTCIFKN